MPKERNYNPVQAQRKADKAKAIKKGKTEIQNRRNEKLARKNPNRIQKQIDDLKAITTSGGKLSSHEEAVLAGLEKDLRDVNKAREALGDKAPVFGRAYGPRDGSGPHGGVLGKRRRDHDQDSTDEDVPEDVKQIPMPRDTPPPIPKDVMDAWWARRRARRQAERGDDHHPAKDRGASPTPAPAIEAKTVYEAKPMVRNLQKESVSAFVPSAVRAKMAKGSGQGGLMEPEEADRLEQQGYLKGYSGGNDQKPSAPHGATVEDAEDEDG